MEFAIAVVIEILKSYAQALGWAIGITGSIGGLVLAWKKLNLEEKRLAIEKRKVSNQERIQKRIEWKDREFVFDEALKIIEISIANGFVNHTEISAFSKVCHKSRKLFPKEIQQYLTTLYWYAANLETLNSRLDELNEDKNRDSDEILNIQARLNEARTWLRDQIDFSNIRVGEMPDRKIDKVFYDYMGIE